MKKLACLFIGLLMCVNVFASDCKGIAPKNNLWIGTGNKSLSMTKEEFLAVTEKVAKYYSDVVAAKGKKLVMVNDWEDGTVNAYATQVGNDWEVHMFGGLARHPLTTNDGFAMVVCHELGHHLGGAPKYGGGNDWASNEGQSDYWATLKCAKKVFGDDDNIAIISKMVIDADAVKKCDSVYKNESESALCKRTAMAGKSLAELLGSLGGSSKVAFNTPDKTIVKRTQDSHPAAQCRLDTYFSGGLCDKAFSVDVDGKDPKVGTCVKSEGFVVGVRPLCWYKPAIGE